MELELWEALVKSLVRNQRTPISEVVNNGLYIASYVLALTVSYTRHLRVSFLCMLASVLLSSSAVYDFIEGYHLHLGYSAIYLYGVRYVKNLKVIIALCIMAWFDFGMSWDAYRNAETETWLSSNYINITSCIHVAIIAVCIDWRRLISAVNNFVDHLRGLWINFGYFLHI
jgi:hypothetical protein